MNIKGMEAAIAHARKHGAHDGTTILIDTDGDLNHLFTDGVELVEGNWRNGDPVQSIILDAVTMDRLEHNKEDAA
jgi:hypothetical protein